MTSDYNITKLNIRDSILIIQATFMRLVQLAQMKRVVSDFINDNGIDRLIEILTYKQCMRFIIPGSMDHDSFMELLREPEFKESLYTESKENEGTIYNICGQRIWDPEKLNTSEILLFIKILPISLLEYSIQHILKYCDEERLIQILSYCKHLLIIKSRHQTYHIHIMTGLARIGIYKEIDYYITSHRLLDYLDNSYYDQRNKKISKKINSLNEAITFRPIKNRYLMKKVARLLDYITADYFVYGLSSMKITLCYCYKMHKKCINISQVDISKFLICDTMTLYVRKSLDAFRIVDVDHIPIKILNNRIKRLAIINDRLISKISSRITTKNLTKLALYYV